MLTIQSWQVWLIVGAAVLIFLLVLFTVLAFTLIALLPELGKMSRKQIAALVGLAPSLRKRVFLSSPPAGRSGHRAQQSRGFLASAHIRGNHVPVEEPSTASKVDIREGLAAALSLISRSSDPLYRISPLFAEQSGQLCRPLP
jgi:hypothetical protein